MKLRTWRSLCVLSFSLLVAIPVQGAPASPPDREERTAPPAVGDEVDDFEQLSVRGKKVKLSTLAEQGPVVIVVLRGFPGYQCPLCNRQVAELLAQAKKFQSREANVLLVYPGPAQGLKQHGEEFLNGKKLPENFQLLLDPHLKLTSAWQLRWEAPNETAYPSTFVIDKDRKVLFAKVSKTHGDRASADEILKALGAP